MLWARCCSPARSSPPPLSPRSKAGRTADHRTTQASGGPIDPERAALQLEHVDLAIEVFPDTQKLSGVATLTSPRSRRRRRC